MLEADFNQINKYNLERLKENYLTPSNKIEVIIINWNGLNDTIECIESIKKQKHISPRIHIWDNNSASDELSKIKERYRDLNTEFYASGDNIGFTKATNKVLDIILEVEPRPEYVALINNDTILDPYWLQNSYAFAEEHKADFVSSRMLKYYERNVIDNLGHKMLTTGEIVPAAALTELKDGIENFGACAGAALISTNCLKRMGTFDNYFNTGYEDAELGLRAKMYGYKTLHCDSAIIYHKGGESIKKIYDENYAVKVQKDILYTICKLYPPVLLAIVLPVSLIRNLIIALFSALVGKFNYSKILIKATIGFISHDMKLAFRARKCLKSKKRTINSVQLLAKQSSSLIFDAKRVWKYLILRQNSSLDQYR